MKPILKNLPYFTKQNLSLALGKEGESLNYWIKKLIKEESLVQLKKGFYLSSYYQDLVRQNPTEYETYLEYLANILRQPSYVSLEYVLSKYGFIPEASSALTSVTLKSSRVYSSNLGRFIYRNIKEKLFFGWQTRNFKDKKIQIASLSKALFDFLYLKKLPKNTWQIFLLSEGRFNWDIVGAKDKQSFRQLVKISASEKMARMVRYLQKEKIL